MSPKISDFAVVEVGCDDSESESDSSPQYNLHKCLMCSKEFKHSENLRIHIQSHLGSKAYLRSCQRCKR